MTIDKPQKSHIPLLRQLWKQSFGDTEEFLDNFFHTGFHPDRCRCLTLDGRPAAALYWFDCTWQGRKLAYLYAVATEETFRGQGLCRRLMEDTHRHLQKLGYAGAALVPGNEALFRMYEKLGYHPFCPMESITVEAATVPVSIRPISADTFETLRRLHLPENAVLQEKETIAFLATFAEFYTGEDTLLCVSREDGTLYFQEYLGKASLLPGILAALHAKKGILRLPGGDKPFAMYHSFDGSDTLPAYLGIALN